MACRVHSKHLEVMDVVRMRDDHVDVQPIGRVKVFATAQCTHNTLTMSEVNWRLTQAKLCEFAENWLNFYKVKQNKI